MRPSPAPSDGAVVLLAEDEDSLRGMLEILLRTRGYRVISCANGAVARDALLGDARIDAALFDVRMPIVTGGELLSLMRHDPRRVHIPAIAMSAYGDDVQAHALMEAGADAFLAKPFALHELTATLEALLRAASAHQA
jgi:DNA-binding response OmpR family regulator